MGVFLKVEELTIVQKQLLSPWNVQRVNNIGAAGMSAQAIEFHAIGHIYIKHVIKRTGCRRVLSLLRTLDTDRLALCQLLATDGFLRCAWLESSDGESSS